MLFFPVITHKFDTYHKFQSPTGEESTGSGSGEPKEDMEEDEDVQDTTADDEEDMEEGDTSEEWISK